MSIYTDLSLMIKCQSDSNIFSASRASGPFLTHFDMSAKLTKKITKNVFHLSLLRYSMLWSLLDCWRQKWSRKSVENRLNEKTWNLGVIIPVLDISLLTWFWNIIIIINKIIIRIIIGIIIYHACKSKHPSHEKCE